MGSPIWIPVWLALIASLPGIIAAIGSVVNMIHLGRMKDKMSQLETNTNSKMDKLLQAKDDLRASTNTAKFAEGKLEGQKEGQ